MKKIIAGIAVSMVAMSSCSSAPVTGVVVGMEEIEESISIKCKGRKCKSKTKEEHYILRVKDDRGNIQEIEVSEDEGEGYRVGDHYPRNEER